LRCPETLVWDALCKFFPIKEDSKACNWDPTAKQPWTYKLQQKILQNTF
jgi:hypothetical protein